DSLASCLFPVYSSRERGAAESGIAFPAPWSLPAKRLRHSHEIPVWLPRKNAPRRFRNGACGLSARGAYGRILRNSPVADGRDRDFASRARPRPLFDSRLFADG